MATHTSTVPKDTPPLSSNSHYKIGQLLPQKDAYNPQELASFQFIPTRATMSAL
jgi:hypothetical protein